MRCQKRKIRCDGALPVCSNCRSAGATCTDGASARIRGLPRAHITGLQKRVAWLESIIRSRCPDVDLSRDTPDIVCETEAVSARPLSPHLANGQGVPEIPLGGHSSRENTSERPLLRQNPSGVISLEQTAPGSRQSDLGQETEGWATSTHQIGLIALGSGQDPRYIGPSSGYFLARVLLQSSEQVGNTDTRENLTQSTKSPFPCELVESMLGPLPMPSKESAKYLSASYFDLIHIQFPILHQPTFMVMLDQMYTPMDPDPVVAFQVFMVLAIGASASSRRSRPGILGDSYGITAMKHFDQINVQNSLQGLQCLLLMSIYAMHNPSARFNIWYLNYQCIAALLDLGLQRKIDIASNISLYEQEMRTRLFWSVYTLDRTIATTMGRPIGLRDEACELRLPQNISDIALMAPGQEKQTPSTDINHMSVSIHLFALARINSEIKYVANSINRAAPPYALPVVADIHEWQNGILESLDSWVNRIPDFGLDKDYVRILCQIRYHIVRMLATSPSPAIPKPSTEILTQCYNSATTIIRLYDQLQKQDNLLISSTILHAITLSAISMMYCTRAVPSIAKNTTLDVLMSDISICQILLSAIGEHWSGAKRCRVIIDELGRSTVRWVKNQQAGHSAADDISTTVPTSIHSLANSDTFSMPPIEIQNRAPLISGVQDPFDPQNALDPFAAFLGDNIFSELADTQWMGYVFDDPLPSTQRFP
ncbi:fungal-specific transcription factor domain-containing protein [Truncatella angustata]|uniref:Fungal-specific transcription factor domain-containing protein n=1 Tax=Truncatella angustata TaxID=152316 RepID=A0A9P8UNS9_9PEZI|nr:fungal-specific transcription factor domain-containing protein [Truncatella angustata]KAH6655681.1 fungal-specific transcription factor domain-containing protein [Truncatella angustata]